MCPVERIEKQPNLWRLTLNLGELAEGIDLGASVAINGTCLTVTTATDRISSFDVIAETLGTTNLGDLEPGSLVNVERSFRVGDEIGGHILSGHVSDQVQAVEIAEAENRRDITFEVPPGWMKYLHHKGFVALDGASLTIARTDPKTHRITVCLIPETIARTTLGRLVIGDRVNLEIDAQTQAVVDTVERVLADGEWQKRLKSAG